MGGAGGRTYIQEHDIMMNPAEFAHIAAAERDFWWYRGMRAILFGLLDPLACKRSIRTVLEAGCGTGHNAALLRRRYGWKTYALDLQTEALRYAKESGVSLLTQGDVAALPFRSGTFDAVIALDVIAHFPRGQESRVFQELARVLAPGGLVVLRVAALDFLRSRHSEFTFERQRFTAKRLLCGLVAHGIRQLRCTYANTLLLPIATAKFRIWEPLMHEKPASGVRPVSAWLNRSLAVPLAAESRWLRAGLNLPLGQSLILIGEKQP